MKAGMSGTEDCDIGSDGGAHGHVADVDLRGKYGRRIRSGQNFW